MNEKSSFHAEAVVVGAGVIGLACARALALAGREVLIIEAKHGIGMETSARNSEVIHAGLYYPSGSHKARLCVDGRRRLYAYCEQHGVAHRRCGKLIVATDTMQHDKLDALHAQARANGVDDVERLTLAEIQRLEPQLHCTAALLSPSTGIIDSHGLMLALLGDAQSAGAQLALDTPVLGAQMDGDGLALEVGGAEPATVVTEILINAAGHGAVPLAARIGGLEPSHVPHAYLARGNYFQLSGRAPFSHLVYPLPEPGGLGVHLTLDLAGQARFGPDVEWIDCLDYTVDATRSTNFYQPVRRYWPDLRDGALQPAYAGIRPKISAPDEPAADFLIQGPRQHGVAGLVNLFGIESPGLTSCLAIAQATLDELDLC